MVDIILNQYGNTIIMFIQEHSKNKLNFYLCSGFHLDKQYKYKHLTYIKENRSIFIDPKGDDRSKNKTHCCKTINSLL